MWYTEGKVRGLPQKNTHLQTLKLLQVKYSSIEIVITENTEFFRNGWGSSTSIREQKKILSQKKRTKENFDWVKVRQKVSL